MKKSNIIIVCLVVVALIILLLVFSKNNKSDDKDTNSIKAVYDIKYSIPKDEYCSCITFYSNGKFSEYDCESEPSEMPFAGEFYDKYTYNSNKITFKGNGVKDVTAEVLNWNQDKLTLKVLGSKQNKKCSSNNNDTYEYYVYELKTNGKKIMEMLNEINNDKLLIEYFGDDGYSCNRNEGDRCIEANYISTSQIKSELEKDGEFTLTLYRDEDGKVKSVYLNKM